MERFIQKITELITGFQQFLQSLAQSGVTATSVPQVRITLADRYLKQLGEKLCIPLWMIVHLIIWIFPLRTLNFSRVYTDRTFYFRKTLAVRRLRQFWCNFPAPYNSNEVFSFQGNNSINNGHPAL